MWALPSLISPHLPPLPHLSPFALNFVHRSYWIRIATNSDKPSGVEGFPLRQWNIEIVLLNEHGEEVPAAVFEKVTYKLHPSFDKRATQGTKAVSYFLEMETDGGASVQCSSVLLLE